MTSYRLAVWHNATEISNFEAATVYLGLAAHKRTNNFDPDVYAFYTHLTAIYPEVELVPEDELDSCPWACANELGDAHAILEILPRRAGAVGQLILSLASEHGLVCFDPQGARVYLPLSMKSATGNPFKAA